MFSVLYLRLYDFSFLSMLPRIILILSVLSGVCGIAYEILFSRILTTYLGHMFYVNASILAAFMFSLGLGSLLAHRRPALLGKIEIGIGIYALAFALLFYTCGETLVGWIATNGYISAPVLVALVFAGLMVPSMLIGFSVPLFTLYRQHLTGQSHASRSFNAVYIFYNLGAAACVLAVEYLLLRQAGITAAVALLAGVNVLVGLGVMRLPAPPAPHPTPWPRVMQQWVLALFVASIASGGFQLFYLKISNTVFGPFHENFALILATALVGMALGSAISSITRIRFPTLLLLAGLMIGASTFFIEPWIMLWAELNTSHAGPAGLSWLLKKVMLCTPVLLPFALLGATIPVVIRQVESAPGSTGFALAVSSFGNCIGFLATIFFLHETLPDAALAALPAVLLLLAACIALPYKRFSTSQGKILAAFLPCLMAVVVGGSAYLNWPEKILYAGYRTLSNTQSIEWFMERWHGAQSFKAHDNTVNLVHTRDNRTLYIINGYRSLTLGGTRQSDLRESVFGASPALFSQQHNNALVLGLGSGITTGGTAAVYKQVHVAEINPLTIEMLPLFAGSNLNLHEKENVTIELQDGLLTLLNSTRKYDAIINTVTSPAYFASSKLYTTDFFRIAAQRLNEGGVYALWFDSRVPYESVPIIFASLSKVFKDCRVLYLSMAYHQVICGMEPLQATLLPDTAYSDELQTFFREVGVVMPLSEFMLSLTTRRHPLYPHQDVISSEWNAPLNTFDHPTLEFAVAQNVLGWDFNTLPEKPAATALWLADPISGKLMSAEALGRRCAALDIISYSNQCNNLFATLGHTDFPLSYWEIIIQVSSINPDALSYRMHLLQNLITHGDARLIEPLVKQAFCSDLSGKSRQFILYLMALISYHKYHTIPEDLLDELEKIMRHGGSWHIRDLLDRHIYTRDAIKGGSPKPEGGISLECPVAKDLP